MKKVNISSKNIARFAGKWVAINDKTNRIVAVGKTLKEIAPFVAGKKKEVKKIKASAFLVPRKGEGPYVLAVNSKKFH